MSITMLCHCNVHEMLQELKSWFQDTLLHVTELTVFREDLVYFLYSMQL